VLSGRAPRALKNSGESGLGAGLGATRPRASGLQREADLRERHGADSSRRLGNASDLDRETPDKRMVDNFGVC
jgi:hypothetical protein